ncbi:MAG: hypothetical protein PF488_01365 [Patescibacteria group bacterium]|nr:hypothetical protein [Patescibacteria group bacterium]
MYIQNAKIKKGIKMEEKKAKNLNKQEKKFMQVDFFCTCFMEVLHLNKHVNNNIQSVLDLLIRLSELKGPNEYMAQVYNYSPHIRVVVEEKSEDFMYHSKLFLKFQENMDNYFDKIDQEVNDENLKKFHLFIKKEGKVLQKELEMYKELEKIHNKTTHV